MVQTAVEKGMSVLCLTEHMPREETDFYPEEGDAHTEASLAKLYDDFYHEGRRLQETYADRIQLFVGFESEWIRESSHTLIKSLLDKYPVDLFVGSVHHVHTVPIDYDTPLYHKARDIAGGTDERIFEDYFTSQYEMLRALQPPVVGHFDLIRLKSDDPDLSFRRWPGVWEQVIRNLRFVAEYGGVLELNSSSLRKGMKETYPQVEICQEFLKLGGRFTLSDDSHGVDQVGLNYQTTLKCVERAGITELYYLAPTSKVLGPISNHFPNVRWSSMPIAELEQHAFWAE
ncbi:hypothetical protein LTR08_009052 [Meristemomyces frigidus]|nr:hypothetical protein LTR08_009052 [Meristemomyces frigidus]